MISQLDMDRHEECGKGAVEEMLASAQSPARTLRFRAWNPKTKTMIPATGLPHTGYRGSVDLTNHVYTQFTGLTDKNGKEIYEGDILKRSRQSKPTFVAVIEFSGGMFGGATLPCRNHWLPMNRLHCCDSDGGGYDEVIGNIYEHQHLIPA